MGRRKKRFLGAERADLPSAVARVEGVDLHLGVRIAALRLLPLAMEGRAGGGAREARTARAFVTPSDNPSFLCPPFSRLALLLFFS